MDIKGVETATFRVKLKHFILK
ncbi:hypothetical protein [Paenibacillus polymyxa]|nr:hypothetical protein [Paenibacillus polymyxa]